MSIKTKFIIYFSTILIISSSLATYSIWHSLSVDNYLNKNIPESINLIQKNSKQNTIAQLVRYDDEVLTQSARNYAFTGDIKWKERYYEFVPKLDLRIQEAVDFGDQEDVNIFNDISSANTKLVELEEKAISYVDKKDLKSAQKILNDVDYLKQKDIYKSSLDKYLLRRGVQVDSTDPVSTQFLKETKDYLSMHFSMEIYSILALVIVFLLTIFFLFWVMYKTFMVPLNIFKKTARKIINGNLNEKVNIKDKNEIGEFANDFNLMTENLNVMYRDLDKKVDEKTEEIETKNKEAQNQKLAILNILEDVEMEKENIEKLLNDLEKFKLAVENASDQVIITDIEGIVIYGNKAVEKITGFTPNEAIGKKAGTLWKTPMPQEYYENLWDIIKIKKEVFTDEIKNKRKNGEYYIANISISPVLDSLGNAIYFVAIEHDITKEKEIDRAKTEFVSLASHQLRTPLSSINWYTEMLLAGDAGKINEEQEKYLNEIAIGNKRMVDLVDSLLNVSRLDLGTFIIEPEILNIVEVSKSVISELKQQIENKKIKIEELYKDDVGDFVADRKLIRIIFQNLLSNAVKYTLDSGNINIEILKIKNGDNWGGKNINEDSLAIKISDSGIGIPKNQQDKMFSKMFRADNARESETEGTGLGLYIIQSIVDKSGGSIWFESEENKGTTFYVIFSKDGMKKRKELGNWIKIINLL
jgi:PAS domain S-box-containing protein